MELLFVEILRKLDFKADGGKTFLSKFLENFRYESAVPVIPFSSIFVLTASSFSRMGLSTPGIESFLAIVQGFYFLFHFPGNKRAPGNKWWNTSLVTAGERRYTIVPFPLRKSRWFGSIDGKSFLKMGFDQIFDWKRDVWAPLNYTTALGSTQERLGAPELSCPSCEALAMKSWTAILFIAEHSKSDYQKLPSLD